MRRVMFTFMSVAVLAFVPAAAVARSHHKHHHHHSKRHHVRTHRFGRFTPKSEQSTPTTPPPTSQTAGTVSAFDPTTGKLTITLADGTTTETGLVTNDTEIECQAMNDENGQVQGDFRRDDGPGGGDGPGDNNGGNSGGDDGNGGGDDNGGGDEANQNCS